MLAISTIQNSKDEQEDFKHIKMAQIKSDVKEFEFIDDSQIKQFAEKAKTKYPSDKK